LDAIAQLDPKTTVAVALFRQLVQAEQCRQQFYTEGRLPEFLDNPPPELQLRLEASIRLRKGLLEEAAQLLNEAENQRPRVPGLCDGHAFDDLRDMDDLTASFFEVLTTGGNSYWIPIGRVRRVEFLPPEHLRDVLWRRAHLVVRSGPEREVFLPTLYAGS